MKKVKIKRDYEAFLDGYKPALIMAKCSKYLHLVEHYPSYCFDKDVIYFFQTNEQREEFIEKVYKVGKYTYEECILTGLMMGYPKKSVEFFARNDQVEKETGVLPNQDIAIGMVWAGFRFITSLDILIEEARWMWETYKHPKAIENPMYFWSDQDNTYLSVPYGDYDRLREVREYIMKERGLIVTNK